MQFCRPKQLALEVEEDIKNVFPVLEKLGVLVLLALASVLRLWGFWKVPTNSFYDAAVRSMSENMHNFLVGAFEPGGSVATDKPPGSLWLQVFSVKLFGFSSVSLRLPEVIAGILAVYLVYSIGRMLFGYKAGLIAGFALAVLPNAVLLSRSDTPDSLLMCMMTIAAWLSIKGATKAQYRYIYGTAFVFGLAFLVKFFEGFLALPAIIAFIIYAYPKDKRLLFHGLAALLLLVITAAAWPTFVSLSHNPPWADGSTNGSIWNTIFYFNGLDRLSGHTVVAHLPHDTGLTRLFNIHGSNYFHQVGGELATAFVFAVFALLSALQKDEKRPWLKAGALLSGIWLICGFIVYSEMRDLFVRYLEGFVPAIALTIGLAAAYLIEKSRTSVLSLVLFITALFIGVSINLAYLLTSSSHLTGLVMIVCLIIAIILIILSFFFTSYYKYMLAPLVISLIVSLFLPSYQFSHYFVKEGSSGVANVGYLSPSILQPTSAYLALHSKGVYDEAAILSYNAGASLIVKDGRPVIVLTAWAGQQIETPTQLAQAVLAGKVRYAFISGKCQPTEISNCTAVARYIQTHGKDVSKAAHLQGYYHLWLLVPQTDISLKPKKITAQRKHL